MNKQFNIKVSDLLQKPGKIDSIELTGIKSIHIPGLDNKGIYGTLELRSSNNDSVFARLEDINCKLNKICDSCQKEYTKTISIAEYEADFTEDKHKLVYDDSAFPIDENNNINIEDMLVQSIILQESMRNYCNKCQTKIDTDNIEKEDEINGFESTENVRFINNHYKDR